MRKFLTALLVIAVLFGCTSCKYYVDPNSEEAQTGPEIYYENGTYGTSKQQEDAFLSDTTYIQNHMPSDYFFEYKTVSGTGEDAVESVISGGKSGEDYYINVDDAQSLYIQHEDGFLCYTREGDDDEYKLMNDDYLLDTEAVSSQLLTASSLFGYYVAYTNNVELYREDEIEIAGKTCVNYRYDANPLGEGEFYILFSIEPTTGVCMKTLWDVWGEGDFDKRIYNFECTRFDTENIVLPGADTVEIPEQWQ